MTIKSRIRTIQDHPKKGIMFRDITTLIKDPVGFRLVIDNLTQRYIADGVDCDIVVGIESRGFIIGGALAYTLGKGFVPIRKAGKLPAETVSHEYELEYGTDKIEMHTDAIIKGMKVLLVDDEQEVARAFDAVCTPDIYVYDQNRKLAYHGRIDDSWKDAFKVNKHELREAIDTLLTGKTPAPAQMPSMGCSIKWKRS